MEDPVLNRSLVESKELQKRWTQFRDFVRAAIEKGGSTPAAEMKFLELKSIIAMLHDGFMAKLEHEQKTGQNIMAIVADSILLSQIAQYNEAEKQKFEFDWNECYLLINEHVQALEEKKQELAQVSEGAHKARQRKEQLQASLHNFLHSTGLKVVIGLFVAFMVLYGIPAFGIFSYRAFRDVPGLAPVYVAVVNMAYRPFLDKDYAFDKWEDIPQDKDLNPAEIAQIDRESNADLSKRYFRDSVLFELGLSQQDAEVARRLLQSTPHFETERYTANGQDVRLFYMMFEETAQAREFVDLVNDAVDRLPPNRQKQITDRVHLARNANFLGVGISDHLMRRSQIEERFKFMSENAIER